MNRHSVILLTLCGLLLIGSAGIRAENQTTEVIPMQHRPASLLLDELRPLMDGEVKLTAVGNKLIARGARSEILALKLLIEELDQPLVQFRISVRQDNASRQADRGVRYSHESDHVRLSSSPQSSPSPQVITKRDGLTVTHTTKSTTNQVMVHRNSRLRGSQSAQEVRATEGYPAYIELGREIPVTRLLFFGASDAVTIHQDYQPVVSGFYVIPTLANDREVLLELNTRKQSVRGKSQIETQSYGGSIRGRLNEWIYVGGVNKRTASGVNGTARHRSSDLSQQGAIYLKVEALRY